MFIDALSSKTVLPFLAGIASVMVAGCGESTTSTSTATLTPTPTSTPTATSAAQQGGLSGTWSGSYSSSSSSGTFTLTWQQSGSTLSGTITINSGATLNLTGSLQGNAITFGTVGSTAITYSGTVSGSLMSGSYQAPSSTGTVNGTWSASKTS